MEPAAPRGNVVHGGFPFSRLRGRGKRGASAGQLPPAATRGAGAAAGARRRPPSRRPTRLADRIEVVDVPISLVR